MRPVRIALLGALVSLLAPRLAAAQPASPPPPSTRIVVPPRPLTPLHADYPEGARGDARVLLVITVNADGSVRSAQVAEGASPFTEAAIAASSGWRFEPATRDGKPTAAAIRAEIAFTAPVPIAPEVPPEPAVTPPIAGASAAPKPPPPPPPPIEITVRGELTPPGATTMSRAEVRLLPGAFGDPFRAVEMLPGVTPIASGVPFFYVRGAPPGNVGYFLDGIRVPLLYHLGLGPSVIHPAIMDRVDLYPGGYPARFGRFAGGIVAGETREPEKTLHGEANLRILDAGALVEAPFADGRGAALVGGRYSYTGLLLSVVNLPIDLRYWDYQARFGFDLDARSRLTVFAFGAYDFLAQKNKEKRKNKDGSVSEIEFETLLFDTTFHRVDLRFDHRFTGGAELRQALTFGWDKTRLAEDAYARDRLLSARTEIKVPLTNDAILRAGVDVVLDVDDVDLTDGPGGDGFKKAFVPRTDLAASARADVVWQVTPRLEVTPGLRLDVYNSLGITEIGVDPRLAARVTVRPWMRVLSALGLATQPPSFILPGPGFTLGLKGGLQRSAQSSLGVELDLPGDVQATVTAFHSAFFNMTDALGTSPPSSGDFAETFNARVVGSGTGLEVTARRRLTRALGGFFSYTLSRSNRDVVQRYVVSSPPNVPKVDFFAHSVPSTFDRTHVLNLALGYDFGRGYRAGARLVFYTGYPFTTKGKDPVYETVVNPERLRPFYRIDARLEKKWTIGRTSWLSLVLEMQNATLNKEIIGRECDPKTGCHDTEIGPVAIPSLGLEGGI